MAKGTVYGVAIRPGEPAQIPLVIPPPPAADAPHFDFPFRYDSKTKDFAVNQQDTPEEILACEAVIVNCPVGYLQERPDFGISSPLFKTQPINITGIEAALRRLEPRGKTTSQQWQDLVVDTGSTHIEIDTEVD